MSDQNSASIPTPRFRRKTFSGFDIADRLPPPAVTSFAVVSIGSSIAPKLYLSWIKSAWDGASVNDVQRYTILRSILPDSEFDVIFNLEAGSQSWIDDTVTVGVHYYYIVRTVDSMPNSSDSTIESATPDTELIEPVTAFTASDISNDQDTKILLEWTKSVDDATDVASYKIYRSELPDSAFSLVHTADPGTETWTDTNATLDTKYYYYVRTTDTSANTADSETKDATATDQLVNGVTGFTAADIEDDQATSIKLDWTKSVDDATDVASYKIYRSELPDSAFSLVHTADPGTET
ncbi:MAG: hypothetical protein NTV01_00430, partial [Bacteroidia bacterium]|nr:hypothetical protein [Bacteroidia bacterium]